MTLQFRNASAPLAPAQVARAREALAPSSAPSWGTRWRKGGVASGPSAEPRVLLLTSSLGSGHMRAAQAVEAALLVRRPGARVMTLDFWSLMDEQVAWTVRTTYLRLVQEHPALFDRIYRLDQHTWRAILERGEALPPAFSDVLALMPGCREPDDSGGDPVHRTWDRLMLPLLSATLSGQLRTRLGGDRLLRIGLVQAVLAQLTRRLVARVRAFAPDAIVATQMNSPALLSLARRRLRIPTIAVPTDFGLHDFWVQPAIGHYCVAHDSIDGLDGGNIGTGRVVITGIPLMPGFLRPPTMAQARGILGLDPARPAVVVVGGGLGLGVQALARELLASDRALQVLVVTGRNGAADQAMRTLALEHAHRLQVHGWTDRMEMFMCAADFVVGKPGGLTLAEVMACGRPLLATQALGGQESFNVRFLERHRIGKLVEVNQLADAARQMLADGEARRAAGQRASALGRRDGADCIAQLVETVACQRTAVAA